MKKIIALVMSVMLLLISTCAGANAFFYDRQTLILDGASYNEFANTGFDFDTLIMDIILMSDKTFWYQKTEMLNDKVSSTGWIHGDVVSKKGEFTFIFPNGETFGGYYEDDDLWLEQSGHYFRMHPVEGMELTKEFK